MNESSQKDTDLKEKTYLDFEVISPIHIGTKDGNLSALEFVFHECRTYIIDENKFAEFLKKNNDLLDKFVEDVRKGNFGIKDDKIRGIKTFFEEQKNIKLDVDEAIKVISRYSITGGSNQMKNFRPFVRDGFGNVFLPGSSIKGVFRTALLYGILQQDKDLKAQIENEVKGNLSKLSEDKEGFSKKWLQAELLQNFELSNIKKMREKEEDLQIRSYTDILRCLTVRDAYPIGKIKSEIIQIQILSKGNERGFKPFKPWLEAITSGKFRFELIWDKHLFEKFKEKNKDIRISGIDDLKNFIFQMSNDIFEHEERFYSSEEGKAKDAAKALKQWYENKKGKLMRIGFGSGMLSTTVNSNFKDEDDNGLTIMQRIRNICYKRENDTSTAPKSRRVWQDNNRWYPMGWLMRAESPVEKLLKELSLIPPNDNGRIGTVIQKIEFLQTNMEKAEIAEAIRNKIGPNALKKHKRKDYLMKLIENKNC